MNILALDLGTRCGWALRENGRIESGVQVFDVKRGESPGMRYVRFRRWLEELVVCYPTSLAGAPTPRVDLIVYEQAHHRGGAATQLAVGLQTLVLAVCATNGIDHAPVHSATLKKATTGAGRGEKASKMAMHWAAWNKAWLPERLTKYSKDSEDEVDAICLLHYALEELAPGGVAAPASEPKARGAGIPVGPSSRAPAQKTKAPVEREGLYSTLGTRIVVRGGAR